MWWLFNEVSEESPFFDFGVEDAEEQRLLVNLYRTAWRHTTTSGEK
jgi:hypothetical protein